MNSEIDGLSARIAELEAALRNLVSAVEATRKADDTVCWNPSDDAHAVREDAHVLLIICENEARALLTSEEAMPRSNTATESH